MSITESTATALLRFTGMGMVKFCGSRQRSEISIVRDSKHILKIRIQQPVFKDGLERDAIVYEDLAVYENLPATGVEIEITTNGQSAVSGFEVYRAAHFDRLQSEDLNDFNWVVSMEELHGENLVNSLNGEAHPTSEVIIKNGFFYVHKLDTKLFFEKVTKDADGEELSRETFGNVAETVGAKLEADEVVFKIKTDEFDDTHVLAHVPGLPFRIEITNMDTSENAVYSDMPDYYKYFAVGDGTYFEFEPIQDDEGAGEIGGGSVNSEAFCHPVEAPC